MGSALDLSRKARRRKSYPLSRFALFVFFVLSTAQYIDKGEVTWMTDAFRLAESKGNELRIPGRASDLWGRIESKLENTGTPSVPSVAHFDLIGTVYSVTDGDTFKLRDRKGKSHVVRFAGIDTPEANQPGGTQATRALKQLVLGKQVGIQVSGKGYYGRTIGTVYVGDTNVGLTMVCNGRAWWYRKYASSSTKLRACEQQAKSEELGIWAGASPVPPWEWRRG